MAGARIGEFLLSNGESYSGSLLADVPEGSGKYVWSDGCIYEGGWSCGMRHGSGKMQWHSGSVYEGEFSGGYMHGTGKLYSSKIIYNGRWRLNLKHGLGYQVFANGDVFEGSWIHGREEGPGKYTWVNGNFYVGNMKGGNLSGKGIMTWENGDSFEGTWLNGMMHGLGMYTWGDGGCYIGTWAHGLKDGKGSFYSTNINLPNLLEMYHSALKRRGLLPSMFKHMHSSRIKCTSLLGFDTSKGKRSCMLRHGSSDNIFKDNLKCEQDHNKNVSLKRFWSLDSSIEKTFGHDFSSISLVEDGDGDSSSTPILEREYIQGVLISELVMDSNFLPLSQKSLKRHNRLVMKLNKLGKTIIQGHRSYDLMLNLQLGIRYTVGKITPLQKREVRACDYGPRASFRMDFPREGSKLTPSHRSTGFRWKDYCPMIFRDLREMFKIDAADYMVSICGNDALRELSSPGKSGSMFFLSQDDHFMIKTLRKSEVRVLLRMLPKYHHHVRSYQNTLITKFFGLHRVEPSSGQKFRFVVMGNMFCTELRIHRRFDLKGSSLGRSAEKVEIDENTILKDLDLDLCFYLEPSWREALLRQILVDSKFLQTEGIMDYSLLLGVHFRAHWHLPSVSNKVNLSAEGLGIISEEGDGEMFYPRGLVLVTRTNNDESIVVGSHMRGNRLRSSSVNGSREVDLLLPGVARLQIQLGVNMPARAERVVDEENRSSHEAYDVVLYMGLIDILQEYNMKKKIEHACKSIQYDSLSISAVDPVIYSSRFLNFMQKVFPSKG